MSEGVSIYAVMRSGVRPDATKDIPDTGRWRGVVCVGSEVVWTADRTHDTREGALRFARERAKKFEPGG